MYGNDLPIDFITSSISKQRNNGCNNLPNGGPISIVWAWHDPPLLQALTSTLESIALHNHNWMPVQINILCGSTSCMEVAYEASSETSCLSVSPLLVNEMAKDTPMESWASNHLLAKLLYANHFEEILQVAVQLVVLLKNGGMVLLPGSILTKPLTGMTRSSLATFLQAGIGNEIVFPNGGIHAAIAPKFHPIVEAMMNRMMAVSHWPNYDPHQWPRFVPWQSLKQELDDSSISHALSSEMMGIETVSRDHYSSYATGGKSRHFGTLTYQARRSYLLSQHNKAMNRGDEMQGLGGMQFLPRLDAFVERDRLDVVTVIASSNFSSINDPVTRATPPRPALTPTTVFLNAWYGTPGMIWPPPGNLDPVFVAMHLNTDAVKNKMKQSREYLSKHWPIGARDTSTQSFFESIGVHAVFSACMTMTLQPSSLYNHTRTKGILIVDVSEKGLGVVPGHIKKQATMLTARIDDPNLLDDQLGRYIQAQEMKAHLEAAQVVITQRLHVALPAASMGTPVILIMDDALPGGGGRNGNSRFSGLQNAVHSVNVHGKSDIPKAHLFMMNFDWSNPQPNPNTGIIEQHRNALQVLTMCHGIDLFDSGRKFGVIPPSWEYPMEKLACGIAPLRDNSTIHIASAVNPDWLESQPIFSSWLNALYKSNADKQFAFYFLTGHMNSKQRCLVRWMVLQHFPQSDVFTIAIDELLSDIPYQGIQHIPVVTQSRLFLPNLLPCVDHLLWIDIDAMVMTDVSELWNVRFELPKCGIAGRNSLKNNVMDGMIGSLSWKDKQIPRGLWKATVGQKKSFNAGVLVLSLESLRNTGFLEHVAKYWAFEVGGNDQIALNFQCNGTHAALDSKWNVFKDHPTDPIYKQQEDWSIVHMQGANKPWLEDSNSTHGKVWQLVKLSLIDALIGPNYPNPM
jgi:lipopolysaccharide biosynthesis glycosyltransferase